MKRGLMILAVFCLLLCGCYLAVPEAAAAQTHSHCVCGGTANGIGDHVCGEAVIWEPWDGTTTLKDGGHYYLNDTDGDGVITLASKLTIEKMTVSLCLNGVELTCADRTINVNGVKSGSTYIPAGLNICDCTGNGSITSTYNGVAPVLHSFTASRGDVSINLYGGNLIAKDNDATTASDAGVLRLGNNTKAPGDAANHKGVLNMYGGSISGGQTKQSGGNVFVSIDCEFNMYGGTVSGGKAGTEGGNFNVEGLLNLQGGLVTGGEANKPGDGIYIDTYGSLTVGGTARVEENLGSNVYVPSGKVITANGSGNAHVGITNVDTVFAQADSAAAASDFFSDTQAELFPAYENGQVSFVTSAGFVDITAMSISPNVAGMGYKAQFNIPENLWSKVVSYGYQIWREGYPVRTVNSKKPLADSVEFTLRIKNILTSDNDFLTNWENADTKLYAKAFIRLADGSCYYSQEEAYTLRQMLELADPHYQTFSANQTSALQSMYTNYKDIMLGWDMPNIIHADGWTEVSQKQFEENLTKSGDDYLIAPGKYTLTEDFELGDKILRVAVDKEVTICLNGHTISGNARLFKVYGTLNICDCHSDEQEGTLTSALAAESAESKIYAPIAYIYPGTMNIYGGKLIATEKVVSGGVIAVGSGTYHGVQKTPGVLNIMGGHFSGGQTFSSGGLIWVLDKASMNMYAGTLTGGVSDGNGGAIYGGGNTTLNLYGGTVADSTSGNYGGGVYCANDAALLLGSHLTLSNNTAIRGGNVYNNSEKSLVIDGAVITGGSAENYGGGVYCAHGSITLKGDAVVRDNTQGNLYVPAQIPLDTTALTQDSQVYLYNMSAMTLNGSNYLKLERNDYKIVTFGGQTVVIPKSFTIPTDVEGFQVGYGRSDITPTEIGLPLAGYGNAASRLSTTTAVNVYDELKVSCVAITDEQGQTVLLMSVDLIRPSADLMDTIFPAITAATGVPESHIFTTFTHTHSVPETNQINNSKIQRYNAMLPDRFAESANMAMADRQPATMETGSFEVGEYGKQLNFTRHYKYQDASGNWQYYGDNFGNTPTDTIGKTTLQHVTEADRTMHLVKFTRDGKDILVANWRVHPHMTGGGNKTYVSSDLIGTTRYHFEKDTDCHFIYLQGAAGNINETSKLDDEKHGYTYYKYGNDLANQIDMALTNHRLKPTPVGLWQVDNYSYTAVSDIASENEYEHAKAASATFNAWLEENPNATSTQKKAKCEELGYLTWFHFNNVITRHGLEPTYQLPLNTFALGNSLAFYTAPGELWDTVSQEIEADSPFAMTLCIGYSQDHFNYFVYDPTNGGQMTYESYESNNYRFVAPNTINDMIDYWKTTLHELYEKIK